ncbi:MAG: hydantoinase B/oxoprolinase family protein, partial [Myxococcota bacterium]|nr:hydantoinase B/oxoprolinase family protein [Myxococcota bacterium]
MSDPTLHDQVVYGALTTLAREVGYRLKRSAHSSLIRESDDYGAALVSPRFELLAEAETTPLQMGPLAGYCRGVAEALARSGEPMDAGAVYLHNDAYGGASHSPDIGAIAPLVVGGSCVGFVGTAAHHVDIGAAVPGTCIIRAYDTFSEGMRLSAFPVEVRGRPVASAWRHLAANVRLPELVTGDLRAQVAACRWGQRGFFALVERYGLEALQAASERLLDVAEQRMRAAIGALPDGLYSADGYLDGYPAIDPASQDASEVDLRIRVSVRVRGDQIDVDLTGTSPQLDHAPINMPFRGTTDMAVLLTLRSLLLPADQHPTLPHNAGLFRPFTLDAPLGTLVNPIFPAPTIGRFCGGQMVANLVVRALSEVLPERVCAGCSTTKAITFSGSTGGRPWIHMDVTEGAYGAMRGADGLDAVDVLYANTRNNPIEDIELHYPLRVERYALREGTGGDGQWRGGLGPVRDTR